MTDTTFTRTLKQSSPSGALLKRQIIGIHHWVSTKHLQRHVGEMTWRVNRRDIAVTDRMNDIFGCVEGRLRYKTLIAK